MLFLPPVTYVTGSNMHAYQRDAEVLSRSLRGDCRMMPRRQIVSIERKERAVCVR